MKCKIRYCNENVKFKRGNTQIIIIKNRNIVNKSNLIRKILVALCYIILHSNNQLLKGNCLKMPIFHVFHLHLFISWRSWYVDNLLLLKWIFCMFCSLLKASNNIHIAWWWTETWCKKDQYHSSREFLVLGKSELTYSK